MLNGQVLQLVLPGCGVPSADRERILGRARFHLQFHQSVDAISERRRRAFRLSQFLTKQFQVGLVGYVYKEVACDSGSGDRVGCFQSQVVGVGPQLGFVIPLSNTTQGYLNLKSYWEFANQNRAEANI
jgi:hypothetical protein